MITDKGKAGFAAKVTMSVEADHSLKLPIPPVCGCAVLLTVNNAPT